MVRVNRIFNVDASQDVPLQYPKNGDDEARFCYLKSKRRHLFVVSLQRIAVLTKVKAGIVPPHSFFTTL